MTSRRIPRAAWVAPLHIVVAATGILLIGAPVLDAFFPLLPAAGRHLLYGLPLLGTVAVLGALAWYFKALTLRLKVMAVCLVFGLAPLLLVIMVSNRLVLDELHHNVHDQLRGAARQNAAALDGMIRGILDAVRTEALLPDFVDYLAQAPEDRNGEVERRARSALGALLRRDAFSISSYALLDRRGWNVLDTYARDTQPDKSGRKYFQEPISTGLPHVSEVLVSPVTGKPSIFFSAPVRGYDGQTLGVLRVRYDAGMLQRFVLERTRLLGVGMFAVLLDDRGIRLADGLRPDRVFEPLHALTSEEQAQLRSDMRPLIRSAPGTHGNDAPVIRAYLRQEGEAMGYMGRIHPEDARIMICEKASLQNTPWKLVVAMPLDTAMAPVRARAVLAAAVSVLLAVVVALVAMGTARTVSGPVIRLSEAVARLGGDLSQRVAVESDDETGQLATTLNTMSAKLLLAQTQLRDNANRLRDLLDTVLVLRPDGCVEESNSRFPSMFGHGQVGRPDIHWRDLSAPDQDTVEIGRLLAAAGHEGSVSFDWTCRRVDGSDFPARIRLRAFRVPEGDRLLAVITDVSGSRRAEMEAERLRILLRETVDAMPSTLAGVDAGGHIVLWNRGAEKRSSVPMSRALGRPLDEVWPAMSALKALVGEAMDTGSTVKRLKEPRRVDGEVRYEDLLVYPLTGEGNAGAVVRIDDVTDRVRFEEMIVQTEKMLSLGGLAAGMAHEVNNPLAAMLGSVQVIRRRLLASMPRNEQAAVRAGTDFRVIETYVRERDIPRMLDMIQDAGQRAATIVLNMLGFSRKPSVRPEPQPMAELLDKTLELVQIDFDLSRKYDFKAVEIVRRYTAEVGRVTCEAQKVRQVLLNIIRNAAEAMAEKVYPAGEGPRLELGLRRDGERVVISIADNGPGIPESIRGRIFEPFFTTKAVGKGTGLGLSVSYFIVTEELGGTLRVDSSPGRWTRFELTLPLHSPRCELPDAPAA